MRFRLAGVLMAVVSLTVVSAALADPLHDAAKAGDVRQVERLIERHRTTNLHGAGVIEGQSARDLIEPRSVIGVGRKLTVGFEGTKKGVLEDIGRIFRVARHPPGKTVYFLFVPPE